jgi:long-subunit fatty acid transport protein
MLKISRIKIITAAIVSISTLSSAQTLGDPARTDVGVGSRSLAMANNVVALTNDASALFWNPAGMAFSKDREFQVSFGGLSSSAFSNFHPQDINTGIASSITRLGLGNVSFMRGLPRSCSRVAIGFAYQNPYSLDAVLKYGSSYITGADAISLNNSYRAMGSLNFWTGGFAFRITPEFGVGLALSAITGRELNDLSFEKTVNGIVADSMNDQYIDKVERTYQGVDARLGFRYNIGEHVGLGMRIEFPSVIAFHEYGNEELPSATSQSYYYEIDGRLVSYYSGACGLALSFPFASANAEVTARAPHPDAKEGESQSYWQVGAGIGLEVPIFSKSLKLRTGYSWHDYAPYPYRVQYLGDVVVDNTVPEQSFDGEHQVGIGCAWHPNDLLTFDLAYAHRFYNVSTEALDELHQSQRLAGSITLSF